MSENERLCLIIGGPCDGQRVTVDVERPEIMLPAPMPVPAYSPDYIVSETAKLYPYKRYPMETTTDHGVVERVYLYVAPGINPMKTLINRYPGQNE